MKHYYEAEIFEEGYDFPTGIAFDTLEDAIQYSDENGITIIYEIGGNWEEYGKCEFCGEWVDLCELNNENLCWNCVVAIASHGG